MLRHSLPRSRLQADYLAATRNEIAVDEMFLRMARTSADVVGYFPRVPAWIGKAGRVRLLSRVAWRVCWGVWFFGGAILFFSIQYFRLARLVQRTRDRVVGGAPLLGRGAVLVFSSRVFDVVKPAQFSDLPTPWLTFPWVPARPLPEGSIEIPILSLVDKPVLREAFFDAVLSVYVMAGRRGYARWMLQSYTAFRWFVVRRAIDLVSGRLVMTAHYDRWAVLADRSTWAVRRSSSRRVDRVLTIIQHGVEGSLGGAVDDSAPPINLPTLLRCVDELWVYNSNQEAFFVANILAKNEKGRNLAVGYFKPSIRIGEGRSGSRLRILIVGHPLCEAFHAALYRELKAWDGHVVYYKPHPKAAMAEVLRGIGWLVVDDPAEFPYADVLISYPSTLVVEYEGQGIPAVVHPIDCQQVDIPRVLRGVAEKSPGAVSF